MTSAYAERESLRVRDVLVLMRPKQWVKNGFVLAPLLFSGHALDAAAVLRAIGAFAVFCVLASGIYCWNDATDYQADRAHPVKRNRPVASGRISAGHARLLGVVFAAIGVAAGSVIAPALGVVLMSYIGLNLVYSAYLKHLVLLDVFAVAAFFVLRLLAGTTSIGVHPSVWLLLCGGLLSLYLGFAKRRQELTLLGEDSSGHRAVLEHYDVAMLDQVSGILLAVTIVAYIMYTLSSATAASVGSEALSYSTLFVLYGVFRYLYLVRRHHGGDPTGTLLTDRPLLASVVLWTAYCAWIVYRK